LDRGQDGLDGRFGLGGGGPELLGNPLHHLRFSHRALLRVLGGCATRVAPAVDPVDVAGVLLAWQARYPHGNPTGGKLTIGEVTVSRGVHSVSGLSWKTPHASCFSSMGCKAVMASEHDVEITTGVGAFEKSAVLSGQNMKKEEGGTRSGFPLVLPCRAGQAPESDTLVGCCTGMSHQYAALRMGL